VHCGSLDPIASYLHVDDLDYTVASRAAFFDRSLDDWFNGGKDVGKDSPGLRDPKAVNNTGGENNTQGGFAT
jgi:hypothetical protein